MLALGGRRAARREAPAVRRDPAPSRWGYKYQRLMLTPVFRALIRVGLPSFLVILIGGGWFSSEENRELLSQKVADLRESFVERPQFLVSDIALSGADVALAAAITGLLPFQLPVSSFDIDPAALKDEITGLTAVKSASVHVRPGGTLEITVVQRQPVAVWRYVDGLRLVDGEGVMTGMIASRADRAELPLIAGDGARDAIGEALALFAAAAPIAPRVRGLVRMGERRWDLVLDGGQRILLPEDNPVAALERVLALHEAQDMLDLDIVVVDMRSSARPVVRLSEYSAGMLNAAVRN